MIILRRFDDPHCHFRNGELLKTVLPYTVRYAGRAGVMPNTRPRAILTAVDVIVYRDEICHALDELPGHPQFEPLMTIEIRDGTTPALIKEARRVGAYAGKVYPLGVTTNSDMGLRHFFARQTLDTFRAMRDENMALEIHGELAGERVLVTQREEAFLPTLYLLADKIPGLRIVLKHVSSRAGLKAVMELDGNVAGEIAPHYLRLTLNDVLGDGLRPHNACMPTPKDFDDRDALRVAVTSGNPKFFMGSDTAPHPRDKKECALGACGVFNAPVVPELLAAEFAKEKALDRLEDFTSRHWAEFHGLPLNQGTITLIEKEWTVPEQIGSVAPFLAGTKMRYQLVAA